MTTPAAPRLRQAQIVGTSGVRLSWDPVPGADSYGVYRVTDSPDADDLDPLDTTTDAFFLDATAAAGHVYLYGVTTVIDMDESDPTDATRRVNVRAFTDHSDSTGSNARRVAGRH